MSDGKIPVNRTLVGILALGCLVAAASTFLFQAGVKNWYLWCGAFTRVGLLLGAFWLALPSRDREAAWANISWGTLLGVLLAIVALIRLPLKVVVPVAAIVALIGYALRPRAKKRPQRRP